MREKPSSRKSIREIKCVNCDKFTKKIFFHKYRLEDDEYNRISDWTNVHILYGADLYYHSTCMRNYVQKTEIVNNYDNMSNSNEVEDLAHSCQT